MATLSSISGRRIVQVFVRDHRRTISLGRISESDAREIRDHVQQLADAINLNLPAPSRVMRWADGVDDRLHQKLEKKGLLQPRPQRQSLALEAYFNSYLARRTDLKHGSTLNLGYVKAFAVEFFGADRELGSITRGDVKDWKRALEQAGYATATVAMHVKKMRQVLADAQDRKLIDDNPFKSVKAGVESNAARLRYIRREDIQTVIDACPDWEWRLLFALARFAGLRIPSEIRLLRWGDIDFEGARFTVRSSKTERYVGKESRVVPIFPELMPRLLEAQSLSGLGDFVFDRLRLRTNLATQGRRIIARAGLTLWPKTWQNLRSSCETDLAASHPVAVACTWIGNSMGVAMKHYLQVREDDYRRAATGAASSDETKADSDSEIVNKLRELLKLYPRQDANEFMNTGRSLQKAHRALQLALHSTKSYASKFRKQLISNLREQVEQAKARHPATGRADSPSSRHGEGT